MNPPEPGALIVLGALTSSRVAPRRGRSEPRKTRRIQARCALFLSTLNGHRYVRATGFGVNLLHSGLASRRKAVRALSFRFTGQCDEEHCAARRCYRFQPDLEFPASLNPQPRDPSILDPIP